jgi:hypothetical protein
MKLKYLIIMMFISTDLCAKQQRDILEDPNILAFMTGATPPTNHLESRKHVVYERDNVNLLQVEAGTQTNLLKASVRYLVDAEAYFLSPGISLSYLRDVNRTVENNKRHQELQATVFLRKDFDIRDFFLLSLYAGSLVSTTREEQYNIYPLVGWNMAYHLTTNVYLKMDQYITHVEESFPVSPQQASWSMENKWSGFLAINLGVEI